MADQFEFLAGGGAMGAIIRGHDWAATPMGTPAAWPQPLRTALTIMLNTHSVGAVLWGPDMRMVYNDHYAGVLGELHPHALGQPLKDVWGATTDPLIAAFEQVWQTGEGFGGRLIELPFLRDGEWMTTYWDATCSPIHGEDGRMVGLFNVATEVTGQVNSDRLRFGLADLSERLRLVDDVADMQIAAAEVIGTAMDAARVGYGVISLDRAMFNVPGDWRRPGYRSLAGRHRLADFGAFAEDLCKGSAVVIDDVTADPRTTPMLDRLAAVSVGSLINYPIVEHGRTVAILYVNCPAARHWREDEIAFVREAGDRLRQAVERRRAELELRAVNATLEERIEERSAALRLHRDMVQSDDSPVVAFDTDMRITACNRAHLDACWRVNGRESRVGDVLPDHFPPAQADILRGFMARALAGESFVVRHAFGDPDLDVPCWQISYNPLRDDDGAIIGGFHRALDITAEVNAQKELERTQDVLRQSQKLEAIGQLTGGVAHDFNNLLTVIRGSVDLLRRDNVPPERRQRYLDAIGDTADRAAKLTGQLLAFARRQTLEPEVFDVARRLDAVADMLDSVTGPRVAVRFDLPDQVCRIRADVGQFETALVNLAVNARDAMNGEGAITLNLRCDARMPAIRGHGAGSGEFVAISLTDTGCGIAPEDMERIFEPFFTTKDVGKGTGLGLSQVFGFAKQSGGDVDVDSVMGKGATFTLYLPQADPSMLHEERATPSHEGAHGAGRCVLVVEDNLSVGQFATQLLDDLGYRTEWVVSAEEALDRLGRTGDGFDIVFSDVVMPGMGGVELARRLARDMPDLPVVLASGYSHVLAQEGTEGMELLRKPYSANQLSAALQRRLASVAQPAG